MTHDVVRMSSILSWLLTALVCALIVFRSTKSLLLAKLATHIFTFYTLSFFRNEPGHPQELCILLLVCMVASGFWATVPRWRSLEIISLGMLTAALLLIKVNIGIFMILATALALLSHSRRTKLSRLMSIAVGAACIILPFALMRAHLDDSIARRYCFVVTASTIAMLLVLFRVPRIFYTFRNSWIAITSFVCTLSGILIILKMQGVSLYGVIYSLVLLNIHVSRNLGHFYVPMAIGRLSILSVISGPFSSSLDFSHGKAL